MSGDLLTVLRTKGRIVATKRISRSDTGEWQIERYGNAAHFAVHEVPVHDLPSLARALTRIERDPKAFVIRGQRLPTASRYRCRRLLKATIRDGVAYDPTFTGAPRRWLAVDFDNLPAPSWCEKHLARRRAAGGGPDPAPIDPARDWTLICRTCFAVLPDAFQGISCFWQQTSSAGIKPGIRARLWFWLDRPVDDEQAKIWLKGHPVDHSLYNPIQAHYTAAPIFDPPGLDPVPRRSGIFWQLRSNAVPVPEIRKPEPIVVEYQPRTRSVDTGGPHPAQAFLDKHGLGQARASAVPIESLRQLGLCCGEGSAPDQEIVAAVLRRQARGGAGPGGGSGRGGLAGAGRHHRRSRARRMAGTHARLRAERDL